MKAVRIFVLKLFVQLPLFVLVLSFIPSAIFAQPSNEEARSKNSENEIGAAQNCNQFTFDGTKSYQPRPGGLTYHWDLGDGTESSQPVVRHVYRDAGEYMVTLTISDESGSENSTDQTTRIVNASIPPKGTFTAPESVCEGDKVILDATQSSSVSGEPLDYQWYFSDFTRESGPKISKIFKEPGKQRVQLVVTDPAQTGCNSSKHIKDVQVNTRPKADGGDDVILKCLRRYEDMKITFDASGSSDVDNDTLTYIWDFADGHKARGKKVTHQFEKSGRYKVKLYVSDNSATSCGRSVDDVNVILKRSPIAEAGDDISVCHGAMITFDGKDSYRDENEELLARWTFGDGDYQPGLKVDHVYRQPGRYKATLTVENAQDTVCHKSQDSVYVTVNEAPVVSLKPVNKVGCVGETIAFATAVSRDPNFDHLDYFWNFGDGTIIKGGSKIRHTYQEGGLFTVTVMVDDGKKSPCSSASDSISIKVNSPPIADAGPNVACCVEQDTVFNASNSVDPDGDPLTYRWDFGDGHKAQGAVVHHTYQEIGNYDVTVSVDDNQGTVCSRRAEGFTASISTGPKAVIEISQ